MVGIIWVKVDSSNMDAMSYNESEEKLFIKFKGRKTEKEHYVFSGVDVQLFNDLLVAESKGKFFHANIKNKFDMEKVTEE